MGQTLGGRVEAAGGARRTVASYARYADAQRAIDHLSDQGFAVERTAIVAQGLRLVEQVTGRVTAGRAALEGALSGGSIGLLFGLLLGFLNLPAPVVSGLLLGLYGLIFGAVAGAVFALLAHAVTGGDRDFASASRFEAERYEVLVDDEVAGEAEALLGRMPPAAR